MSARPGMTKRPRQSTRRISLLRNELDGATAVMKPFSITTVCSGRRRSESIGMTVTSASASGPASRAGRSSWRNSGFTLGLVVPRLLAHRFVVELVHLVHELVGDELLYVDLGRHAGRALG